MRQAHKFYEDRMDQNYFCHPSTLKVLEGKETESCPAERSVAWQDEVERNDGAMECSAGILAAEQKYAGFNSASGIAALSFDRRYSV